MKYLISACLLALTSTSVAHAQDDIIPNATGLIVDMTTENVLAPLHEVGLEASIEKFDGQDAVAVTYNGRTGYLIPKACDEVKCDGLMMISVINPAQPATHEQISYFNAEMNAGNAVLSAGTLYLKKYVVADYGVTRGSFLIDVVVFLSMIDKWYELFPAEE